jgi:hypothetical protein
VVTGAGINLVASLVSCASAPKLKAAAHRTQADALEIEAQAKRRLADEYDAAQERGEVAANGQRGKAVPDGNSLATVSDLGLTRKAIHEARQLRDAEAAAPGVIRRALDAGWRMARTPPRRPCAGSRPLPSVRSDTATAAWIGHVYVTAPKRIDVELHRCTLSSSPLSPSLGLRPSQPPS